MEDSDDKDDISSKNRTTGTDDLDSGERFIACDERIFILSMKQTASV